MKNFLKSILKYIADHKNKNQKDLKELTIYNIQNLFSKNFKSEKINKKNTDVIMSMLYDLKGTSLVEGLNIIESILNTVDLNGDLCEFGVAQGKTTKLISYLIQNTEKKIYIYDSFEGLPEPSKEDKLKDDIFNLGSIDLYKGKMSHNQEKVLSELKSINFQSDRIVLNKGFFNQKTKDLYHYPKQISFAYIDFDFYQPTKDVLNIIEPKLVKNAIVIVDDYDFFSTGVKTAVDEWLENKNNFFEINKIRTISSSFIKLKKK